MGQRQRHDAQVLLECLELSETLSIELGEAYSPIDERDTKKTKPDARAERLDCRNSTVNTSCTCEEGFRQSQV